MRWCGRIVVTLGVAGIVAAAVVALWPLHANGVSGSALRPHYSEYFGFTTITQLPDDPSDNDLHRAGVRLPKDVVADRREAGFAVLAVALILVVAGAATLMWDGRRASPGQGLPVRRPEAITRQ